MTERSDLDIAAIFPDEDSLKAGRASIYSQPPIGEWPTDLFLHPGGVRGEERTGGVCELIWKEGKVIHGRLK